MRVLHITTNLAATSGGPPAAVIPLLERLGRKGVHCGLVATRSPAHLPALYPADVEVQLVTPGWLAPWWRGYSAGWHRVLARVIPAYDLVHIHELWHYPHFVAARLARRSRRPYIITLHGGLESWALNFKALRKRLYLWVIQRRLLQDAAALHALTEAESRSVRRLGLQTRVEIIPSGIDFSQFEPLPARDELHAVYPQLAGKRLILFLGRLHRIKGLDLLVKAFSAVAHDERFADVRLLLAGPDETGYRAEVESLLTKEGAADKAIFTGLLVGRTKLATLARADLFVLPSYSEGLSRSLLEAMACGIPVVITQPCGLPEVASAGAGEVVELSPAALANAMQRILADASLRTRMGRAGRQLAASRFSLDAVAAQMAGFYRSLAVS